jgi:hypothetical protein
MTSVNIIAMINNYYVLISFATTSTLLSSSCNLFLSCPLDRHSPWHRRSRWLSHPCTKAVFDSSAIITLPSLDNRKLPIVNSISHYELWCTPVIQKECAVDLVSKIVSTENGQNINRSHLPLWYWYDCCLLQQINDNKRMKEPHFSRQRT